MISADILYRAAMRRSIDTARLSRGEGTLARASHDNQNNFMEGGRWFTRTGMVIRDRFSSYFVQEERWTRPNPSTGRLDASASPSPVPSEEPILCR